MACGDREPRGHESPPASSTWLGMGRVRWHFLRPSAASPLGLAQNSVCMVTLDFCVLLFKVRINLCFPFSCRASMLWPPPHGNPNVYDVFLLLSAILQTWERSRCLVLYKTLYEAYLIQPSENPRDRHEYANMQMSA